jgi:hypothetical protein
LRLFSGVTPVVILIAATGGIVPIIPDIKVNDAVYMDGKLTVTGEMSKPDQQVALDGRYSTKTDEDRQFRFEVSYLPKECIITLSSGERSRMVVVRGCDIAAAPVPASQTAAPLSPAQSHGSSSVSQ